MSFHTGFTATTALIFTDAFADGFNFSLLAIGSPELKTPHLECDQTVAQFDQMDQTVQVVAG